MQKERAWYELDAFVIKENEEDLLTSNILRTKHSLCAEMRPVSYSETVVCVRDDEELEEFEGLFVEHNFSSIRQPCNKVSIKFGMRMLVCSRVYLRGK